MLVGTGESVGVGVNVSDGTTDGSSASAVGEGEGGISVGVTGIPVCRLQAIEASTKASAITTKEGTVKNRPGRCITNLLALCYRNPTFDCKPGNWRLSAVCPIIDAPLTMRHASGRDRWHFLGNAHLRERIVDDDLVFNLPEKMFVESKTFFADEPSGLSR